LGEPRAIAHKTPSATPIAMLPIDTQIVLTSPRRIVGQGRYSCVVAQSILPFLNDTATKTRKARMIATAA
jgi:hypothetical protein